MGESGPSCVTKVTTNEIVALFNIVILEKEFHFTKKRQRTAGLNGQLPLRKALCMKKWLNKWNAILRVTHQQ